MIELIRENWNNREKLSELTLLIIERQFELAESIASEEASFNSTFVSEREDMYKGTDTMARAKAKDLVGTSKTRYEYEFEALTNLLNVVTLHISQLGQLPFPVQSYA